MKLGIQVGLGPGHIVLDGDPAPSPAKGHSPPIFGPYLLRPKGCMDQDATWYGGRPQPRRLFVRCGPSPLPKKGWSSQFSAHVYCGQTAAWIKMPLGTEIGLGLRDTVLDGDPAPLRQRCTAPQFSANVRCGQMADGGTEVNLGPGDIVLDGVAASR